MTVTLLAVPRARVSLAFCLGLLCLLLAVSPVYAGYASVVRHVSTDQKVIALTFDDGWSPSRALKIASILQQYGATGTFFPYANAADDSPSTWRYLARHYPIANHTTSHPYLTRLSATAIYREINHARKVIEGITGRPMVRIFRPPYMAYNSTVLYEAYRAGFKIMALWSVDSGDSEHLTDAQVYNHAIQGHRGGIVLFHAGPAVTVRVLPKVLAYYKAHGFRFVTLPELLGIPWSPATTL
jgi:peptidoglycan/xylan/chitin deacetylase (PgdA/CDA1 family)